jgi:hypothetical protein
MRQIRFAVFVVLLFASLASAQVPGGNVFFGYSYYSEDLSSIGQVDAGGWGRANTNGWEASVEGKVIPFLGFVADFDSHYGSQNLTILCPAGAPCPAVTANITEHNFLFGPRVSFPAGRFRPFVEGLFGGAHMNISEGVGSDYSFATALGGGLDYKIIKPLAWRFQGDYVQTRLFGATQNNVRLSTGIVFRF